jgi:hypothetical protein
MAHLRHGEAPRIGLLVREDRKSPVPGQTNANDPGPKRTLSIVPAPIELHEISRNRYRMNDLLNLTRHATRTPVSLAIFLT